jgi:hypothetical protein
MDAQRTVAEDLTLAMQGTGDVPEPMRQEITDGIETLTVAVEQARLVAAADPEEFVETSQSQLVEIDNDLTTLNSRSVIVEDIEARAAVTNEIDVMETEVATLTDRVAAIEDGPPEQVASERAEISRAIAMLSGSVRRISLELPTGSTLQ